MSDTAPFAPGDLAGHVAVVTGAQAGVGFETARALAGAGATVVMAGPSRDALAAGAARIAGGRPRGAVLTGVLDLASLASVRTFAGQFLGEFERLDLLVNAASVRAMPERRFTADHLELTFGANHIGPFALTGLLMPALLASPAPRVVTVSARVARRAEIDFDDFDMRGRYEPGKAWARSKLANVAFAVELAERAAATRLVSVAAHAGAALSRLRVGTPGRLLERVLHRVCGGPDAAARPALYAATSPEVTSGGFYAPTGTFELRGAPGPVPLPPRAAHAGVRMLLWRISEELTGVRYALR